MFQPKNKKMQEVQDKPRESITVRSVFLFLGFIFFIFASFLFYMRYSGYSPLSEKYKKSNSATTSSLTELVKKQTDNPIATKKFSLTISENDLRNGLDLSNGLLDLKKATLKITEAGIIVSGKTGGWFGLPISATVVPKVENGRLVYDVTEIKAADVTAPPKIVDSLKPQLAVLFRSAILMDKNVVVLEVHCLTGSMYIEGEVK
jgi:hypothetical protein